VHRYGLAPYIRLQTRFEEAAGEERESVGHVTAGQNLRMHTRVLVSGLGALHVPRYPDVAGLERFAGPSFHSATWTPEVDLTGKSVAVIGTGASAIQFVLQIMPHVGKLYLFQRTPPWISPARWAISERWRKRFRNIPGATWAFRQFLFFSLEWRVLAFLGHLGVLKYFAGIARQHLEREIKDPKLRRALTPNYEIACKRILLSDDFYPVLNQPHVELVSEKIAEVRRNSVVTYDGVERPVDVLIFGTGFQVTERSLACSSLASAAWKFTRRGEMA
jgi:cation diffusion facilitator CzcD-associated flavoprotein CzcO